MKVCVGSLNRVKVNATRCRLAPYQIEVEGVEVLSDVSAQPMSDLETLIGAKNRAIAAKAFGHMGIGLEAGIEVLDGVTFLVNFGVLVDDTDQIYYAGGTRLPLPDELANQLKEGVELGDIIDVYAKRKNVRSKEGAIGILTADVCTRQVNFEHIVDLLWGQYLYAVGKFES